MKLEKFKKIKEEANLEFFREKYFNDTSYFPTSFPEYLTKTKALSEPIIIGLPQKTNDFFNKDIKENRKVKGTLPELLKLIESTEENPIRFKEAVLGIIQLYFDGLIDNKGIKDPEIWKEQSETLEAVIEGVKLTLTSYYRSTEDYFPVVREVLLSQDSRLIRYGSDKYSVRGHLSGSESEIMGYANDLSAFLRESIDLIIPITSGGFEPALLTAYDLKIDEILPVRYSRYRYNDHTVSVPFQLPLEYMEQRINDKVILVVDDITCIGETASKVIGFVEKYFPSKILFTTVLGKNKNLFHLGLYNHSSSEHTYIKSRNT